MTEGIDIAAIASGLSKAQREVIASSKMLVDGRVLIDCYPPHGLPARLVFMYSMARDKLSPDGLALRQHLLANQENRS